MFGKNLLTLWKFTYLTRIPYKNNMVSNLYIQLNFYNINKHIQYSFKIITFIIIYFYLALK